MSEDKYPFESGKTFSPALEVETVRKGAPHVLILGSGASRAACPDGDKNGKPLPVFADLIETLELQQIIAKYGVKQQDGENFEGLYSRLHKQGGCDDCLDALEKNVHTHFSSLELPDEPTIYDHLILSLRPRDVIATFNWDPLLVQAAMRNSSCVDLPMLLFLHGNVAAGYCEQDKRKGPYPGKCPVCQKSFQPTDLLYPVENKNYPENTFIWGEWQDLRDKLKDACIMTIFGYGAPDTDVEAVELMKSAWGRSEERNMEQIEIIDILSDDELRERWKKFIHTHHYQTPSNFYQSFVTRHPRRTGEAYAATFVFGMFEDGNPLPQDADFPELHEWFSSLTKYENTQ